jgi:hypothetical protein
VFLSLYGCGQPAVLNKEEARQAADALYTAVTAKRPELVRSCEKKIASLKASGELSASGADALTQVIAKADAGDWKQAAEDLDRIIRAEP